MKRNKIIWLLISGILIFTLAGCQTTATPTSPAPTSDATAPQQVAPTTGSYPESSSQANPTAESYPAPTEATGAYPYPSPQEGAAISWDQAVQMIMTGNVTSVVQTQSLSVTLTIKAGQTYTTTAPAADAAQKAITNCGDPCKNLTVTNQ